MELNKAVFLDRDGTLNIDPGYLGDPDKVELFNTVPETLKYLKDELGFKLIVISNQSGIARGLITETQVNLVNAKINEILRKFDTAIDKFVYCPYHPKFNPPEKCTCRKPSPEMILNTSSELNIDLNNSYMVGDKDVDVLCGINAGVKTILIDYEDTKVQINSLKKEGKTPNFVASVFSDLVHFITE